MLVVGYLFQKWLLEIVLKYIALIWDRNEWNPKNYCASSVSCWFVEIFSSFFLPAKANLNIRDIIDSNRWDLLDAQFWFRNLQKKTGFREKDGVHWVSYVMWMHDCNATIDEVNQRNYFRIKSLTDGWVIYSWHMYVMHGVSSCQKE